MELNNRTCDIWCIVKWWTKIIKQVFWCVKITYFCNGWCWCWCWCSYFWWIQIDLESLLFALQSTAPDSLPMAACFPFAFSELGSPCERRIDRPLWTWCLFQIQALAEFSLNCFGSQHGNFSNSAMLFTVGFLLNSLLCFSCVNTASHVGCVWLCARPHGLGLSLFFLIFFPSVYWPN